MYKFQNKEGMFFVPFDAELECKQNMVVYDSNSTNVYFRAKKGCSLTRLMQSWSVIKMWLFMTNSTNVYFRAKKGCSLSHLMLSWSVNKMWLFTTVTLQM